MLMNKHGAWGSLEDRCTLKLKAFMYSPDSIGLLIDSSSPFMRLDLWEDDSRRRMRLIKNPHGTTHPEATVYPTASDGLCLH